VPDGSALVQFARRDAKGKAVETDRWVWTNKAVHYLRFELRNHSVWPIAEQDRGRLPARLALPFLWHVDPERLKSQYSVALVREDAGAWSLSFAPLSAADRSGFCKAYLELDKKSFLPRRYLVLNDKFANDFRVTEARLDKPVPKGVFEIPDEPGWNVMGNEEDMRKPTWLDRLLKPELLP
jgi:hypothetical protein